MKHETYKRTELIITEFEQKDIIVTSDPTPIQPQQAPSKDRYEWFLRM